MHVGPSPSDVGAGISLFAESGKSAKAHEWPQVPDLPSIDPMTKEGEVMRSETRLAYRKARTLFFRDSEFTQIDKLKLQNDSGRGFESLLIVALILPKSRTLREATFVRIFR